MKERKEQKMTPVLCLGDKDGGGIDRDVRTERRGAFGKEHVFGSEFIAFIVPGDRVGICEPRAPGLSETTPVADILDFPKVQAFQVFM